MISLTAVQTEIFNKLTRSQHLGMLGKQIIVYDGVAKPKNMPCLMLGDGHAVLESFSYDCRLVREFTSIHVWVDGESIIDVKRIAGAVVETLRDGIGDTLTDDSVPFAVKTYRVVSSAVTKIQYIRDRTAKCLHAVVEFEALLEETDVSSPVSGNDGVSDDINFVSQFEGGLV